METMTTSFIVAVSVADIRHDPDPTSELVTQALMNTPVEVGNVAGEWTHATLSDYTGWIRMDELEEPIIKGFCEGSDGTCGVPLPYAAVVSVSHTPLYASETGEETLGDVYLSTTLPFIGQGSAYRRRVALPGNKEGWIASEAVDLRQNKALYPRKDIDTVISCALSFLGVPYLWGGTSWRGIDCSGFVQLCYRMGGEIIPRDADQQYAALDNSISRAHMQAGDLLFFGRQRITHVALALNTYEYIHSEGQNYNQVIIHSLDHTHPAYEAFLDTCVWGIKRVRA